MNSNNKIPKIIHYCWFSNEEKPLKIRKCMATWKKVLYDYEIRCWDGNSFDLSSIPIVKQAVEKKKWAFAADYIRLYALYTEGGIYLDSDVEVLKSFDRFLDDSFFIGTDSADRMDDYIYLEAGIFGSIKGHPYLKKCMEYYERLNVKLDKETLQHVLQFDRVENRRIYDDNGQFKLVIAPIVMAEYMKSYGYVRENRLQRLSDGIVVYPTPIFINHENKISSKVYAVHWNVGSWLDIEHRGLLFKFCKKWDLMKIYGLLERIMMRLKNIPVPRQE